MRQIGSHRRNLLSTAAAVALGVLSGCVELQQPAPDVRSYRLDYSAAAPSGPPLPAILRIAPFDVATTYDHESIVYGDAAYATGSYFYYRWSANPGSMVTDLLARDFASCGLYRAVQHSGAPLPPDYQLNGDIEEIEEYRSGSSCAARLRMRVTLVRTRGGSSNPVLLHNGYATEEPCPCSNPSALAHAMSSALARLSEQLQEQVYQALAADTRPARR